MSYSAVKPDIVYTYKDYASWPDDERWEIINGKTYSMSPSPTTKHQKISGELFGRIYMQKEKFKGCTLFSAPMDVIFDFEEKGDYAENIVQPDLFIVCDKKKISEKSVVGGPDLIFEILSASTSIKDKREKKSVYERFSVKEYIIIDPLNEYAEHYLLEGREYGKPEYISWDEILKLRSFNVEINLWEIFEKERKVS